MKKRIVIVFLILLTLFVGVAGRLAYLSGGAEITQYAGVTGSRVISVGINAARGVIYDRNGVPLAGGEERCAVLCEPMSLSGESAEKLRAHAVNIEEEELDRKIAAGYPFLVYVDRPLGGVGLSGITALARYGGLAQNLIGYINADGHGVAGIEAAMDDYLYADGYSYSACFTADAARRALAGYGIAFEGSARPMTQGVTLSLDRQIQQICEEVADERVERGVILVSDLETGQICAWVSRPTYDPNHVEQSLASGDAMLNKALYSYCCGSVFKIVVTAAALENGVELPQDYECTGAFAAGEHTIACAKREGHGILDGKTAFAQSCNPYFCELAARVGAQKVLEMAEKFGLGQRTDLGCGIGDGGGQLPPLRDLSVSAALSNLAIGQGSLLVTPIQVLRLSAIIANGGQMMSFRLFESITDTDGNRTKITSESVARMVISVDTATVIRDMMEEAVRSGSGRPAAAAVYQSAVKTSSAETGIYEQGKPILHTWVTGFYPSQRPQYAIAVLVEGGSSGYVSTAPVFADIVDRMYGCGLVKPVV